MPRIETSTINLNKPTIVHTVDFEEVNDCVFYTYGFKLEENSLHKLIKKLLVYGDGNPIRFCFEEMYSYRSSLAMHDCLCELFKEEFMPYYESCTPDEIINYMKQDGSRDVADVGTVIDAYNDMMNGI